MGVNKVILIGRLGKDPELRYSQSQLPIASFSVATGEKRKDPAQGSWVEHTEWHNIVAFGKTAEFCNNYLKKGREVFVEGKIATRKWQDKEGKDRWTTEIIASNIQFVGGKSDGQGGSHASGGAEYNGSNNDPLDSLPSADSLASSQGGGDVSFDDDDIPF